MNAWVFDVDGVLTDPVEKKITEPSLLPLLAQILSQGDIIALNTGRSLSWVKERVITPLSEQISDENLLHSVYLVGEKGNAVLEYKNGNWIEEIDEKALILKELENKVKTLVKEEFSDSMFFDPDKHTMISIEMKDNFDISAYQRQQALLTPKIKTLISETDLRLDPSVIALDIQHPTAGKHLGARRIAEWLEHQGHATDKVYMFGDTQSDIEMAQELEHDFNVTFVFTNEKEKLDASNISCEVIYTNAKFSKGTIEFLNSIMGK